jgi:hypothetical protein
MKKEASWLSSRCVSIVLLELAKNPLTPMQLRMKTGLTKNNYANIILRKLESMEIAKCLNPGDKIGKVFCIDPASAKRIEGIFRKKGIEQKVNVFSNPAWSAYGRLLCPYCTQLRAVFKKANELRQEGRDTTIFNLKGRLPGIATGDIYRALRNLNKLKVMRIINTEPKRFTITKEGLSMIEHYPEILI